MNGFVIDFLMHNHKIILIYFAVFFSVFFFSTKASSITITKLLYQRINNNLSTEHFKINQLCQSDVDSSRTVMLLLLLLLSPSFIPSLFFSASFIPFRRCPSIANKIGINSKWKCKRTSLNKLRRTFAQIVLIKEDINLNNL